MSLALEQFSFIIGRWRSEMLIYDQPSAEGVASGQAEIDCRWSPQRKWIECNTDVGNSAGQLYRVHVVVHAQNNSSDALTAYAVNTSGSGALYSGDWVQPSHIIFTSIDKAERPQWKQTVAYQLKSDGSVNFEVQESTDGGQSYKAHSSAIWIRK